MAEDESLRGVLARIEEKLDRLNRPGLLTTAREIGAYIRRHPRTVREWTLKLEFPVVHLPNGVTATTPGLIDSWLMRRFEEEASQPVRTRRRPPRRERTAKREGTGEERQGR